MPKARMTRDEKKAVTRTKLIDAAAEVFAERGFAAASLDDVAEKAGLTKGAVYSNFESKDELLDAVLLERLDRRMNAIASMVPATATAEEQARDSGRLFVKALEDERIWFILAFEAAIHAARHPEFQSAYAAKHRALVTDVAKMIEERAPGSASQLSSEDLAIGFYAMGTGFAMEKLRDPDGVPDDLFGEFLLLINEGLEARAARVSKQPRGSRGRRPR